MLRLQKTQNLQRPGPLRVTCRACNGWVLRMFQTCSCPPLSSAGVPLAFVSRARTKYRGYKTCLHLMPVLVGHIERSAAWLQLFPASEVETDSSHERGGD